MSATSTGAYEQYREARSRLSPTQLARVMLKQKWERCSALSVYANWPSFFDPDREQDEDELKACRELIAERPELFPTESEDSHGE